jgi:hypothetical protein
MARAATNHLAGGGGGQLIAVAVRPRPTFPSQLGATRGRGGRPRPTRTLDGARHRGTPPSRATKEQRPPEAAACLEREKGFEPANRGAMDSERRAASIGSAVTRGRGGRPRPTRTLDGENVVQPRRHERQNTTAALRRLCVLEREKGFEPSTSTLARWHSTAELLPRKDRLRSARRRGCQAGSILPRERGPAVRFERGESSRSPRV